MESPAVSDYGLLVLQLISERPDGYTLFGLRKRLELAGAVEGDPTAALEVMEGTGLVERHRSPLARADSWKPSVRGLQLLSDRGLIEELKPRRVCPVCAEPFDRVDTVLRTSRRCEQQAHCPNGHTSYRWLDLDEAWRSVPGASEADYGPELIATRLGLRSLDLRVPSTESDRAARVLFRPSFHPEGAITAVREGSTTSVRIDAFGSSLWYHLSASREGTGPWDTVGPLAPWTNRSTLSRRESEELWETLEAMTRRLPGHVSDEQVFGIDGINISGVYAESGRTHRFEVWSPSRGTPPWDFVHALYAAAEKHLSGERALVWLEQLHGYLDLGAPIKDLPGSPRRLRLFGGLSDLDTEDLRQALERIRPDEPVIVDMTNFEGMGTAVYPLFASFASRSGATAWVPSEAASQQLGEIGVEPSRLFASIELATAALSRPDQSDLPPVTPG